MTSIIRVLVGIIQGIAVVAAAAVVVADEVREGRGRCLAGRHDWWYCQADAPNHDHRHCRRCGTDR